LFCLHETIIDALISRHDDYNQAKLREYINKYQDEELLETVIKAENSRRPAWELLAAARSDKDSPESIIEWVENNLFDEELLTADQFNRRLNLEYNDLSHDFN